MDPSTKAFIQRHLPLIMIGVALIGGCYIGWQSYVLWTMRPGVHPLVVMIVGSYFGWTGWNLFRFFRARRRANRGVAAPFPHSAAERVDPRTND
jgi:hypothetical protein